MYLWALLLILALNGTGKPELAEQPVAERRSKEEVGVGLASLGNAADAEVDRKMVVNVASRLPEATKASFAAWR